MVMVGVMITMVDTTTITTTETGALEGAHLTRTVVMDFASVITVLKNDGDDAKETGQGQVTEGLQTLTHSRFAGDKTTIHAKILT